MTITIGHSDLPICHGCNRVIDRDKVMHDDDGNPFHPQCHPQAYKFPDNPVAKSSSETITFVSLPTPPKKKE